MLSLARVKKIIPPPSRAITVSTMSLLRGFSLSNFSSVDMTPFASMVNFVFPKSLIKE